MTQVEVGMLARLLKILERSVKASEDVNIGSYFPRQAPKEDIENPSKSPTKTKASGSQEPESYVSLSADRLESLQRTFELMSESLMAVEGSIGLLSSDQLPKQVSVLDGAY